MNDDEFLLKKDRLKDQIDNSEKEYDYQESSEEDDDSDIEEAKSKIKKPQQEFQLIEAKFPATMIKTQGKMRLQWDLMIIVFSVYQAFSVPLDIAFEFDYSNSPEVRTANSVIDLMFIMDIIFRFRTTYIDPISGEEVMDSWLIGTRYIKSYGFYIDVFSTFPISDFVGGNKPLQLL